MHPPGIALRLPGGVSTTRRARRFANRFPMTPPPHNKIGVYDRPHPLRTRKVWVPTAIGVVVAIGYGLWFYLR